MEDVFLTQMAFKLGPRGIWMWLVRGGESMSLAGQWHGHMSGLRTNVVWATWFSEALKRRSSLAWKSSWFEKLWERFGWERRKSLNWMPGALLSIWELQHFLNQQLCAGDTASRGSAFLALEEGWAEPLHRERVCAYSASLITKNRWSW